MNMNCTCLNYIAASFDSNGSVPTTDISFETQATQESMYPQRYQPVPHPQAPRKPVDDHSYLQLLIRYIL